MTFGSDHAVLASHRQRVEEIERHLESRRRVAERASDDGVADGRVMHAHAPARGIRRLLPRRRRPGLA